MVAPDDVAADICLFTASLAVLAATVCWVDVDAGTLDRRVHVSAIVISVFPACHLLHYQTDSAIPAILS